MKSKKLNLGLAGKVGIILLSLGAGLCVSGNDGQALQKPVESGKTAESLPQKSKVKNEKKSEKAIEYHTIPHLMRNNPDGTWDFYLGKPGQSLDEVAKTKPYHGEGGEFYFSEEKGAKTYRMLKDKVYEVLEESEDGRKGFVVGFFKPERTSILLEQKVEKQEKSVQEKDDVFFESVRTAEKSGKNKLMSVKDLDKNNPYFEIKDNRVSYRVAKGKYGFVEERTNPDVCVPVGIVEIKGLRFEEVKDNNPWKNYSKEVYFRKMQSTDADNSDRNRYTLKFINEDGSVDYHVTVQNKDGDVVDRYIEKTDIKMERMRNTEK